LLGIWGFKKKFALDTPLTFADRLRANKWYKGLWDREISRPRTKIQDVIFNQRIRGGDITISGDTLAPPESSFYTLRKAYIVWYSGDNYEVWREISITFWVSPDGYFSTNDVRGWLDRAVQEALSRDGTTLSNIEDGWASEQGGAMTRGSYQVDSAVLIYEEGEPSDSHTVRWIYRDRNRTIKEGAFSI